MILAHNIIKTWIEGIIMDLVSEIENCLPIYAYPTARLLKTIGKYKITSKSRLRIISVFNGGYEFGIACGIEIGNEVLVISITHLEFRDKHPLKEKINNYRINRINYLKKQSAFDTVISKSNSIGRNESCPCGSGKKYNKCCGI